MLVDMLFPPLASILVARTLGPTKLGLFSYVSWLAATACVLGFAGSTAAARKFMADYAGQRRPDVFKAILLRILIGQATALLLITAAGLAMARWWLPPEAWRFAFLTMLTTVPAGLMAMATAVNNSVQELRPNAISSIISGLVHSVGLVLTALLGWGLVGLAAVGLVSRTCDCIVRWLLTLKRMPGYLEAMRGDSTCAASSQALPPGLGRQIWSFVGESTILTVLTLVVWSRSEMIFLKRYSAIEQIAYFSVAFSLSQIPGQLVGPFSRAAAVAVFGERGRDQQAGLHVTQVYWRYLVLLVLPACLGLAVLAGPLLRVLYGARYSDAVPVLMVAGALSMFASLANPATTLVTAAGGQRRLVLAGILAAVATLTLDYCLVRPYGAMGGAVANGLGQAISTAAVVLVAHRYSFRSRPNFVLRVTAASLVMALAVFVVVALLPDLVGIAIGPVVGAFVYGASLRVGRVIDAEDVERLLKAQQMLPRPLRDPFRRVLQLFAHKCKGC